MSPKAGVRSTLDLSARTGVTLLYRRSPYVWTLLPVVVLCILGVVALALVLNVGAQLPQTAVSFHSSRTKLDPEHLATGEAPSEALSRARLDALTQQVSDMEEMMTLNDRTAKLKRVVELPAPPAPVVPPVLPPAPNPLDAGPVSGFTVSSPHVSLAERSGGSGRNGWLVATQTAGATHAERGVIGSWAWGSAISQVVLVGTEAAPRHYYVEFVVKTGHVKGGSAMVGVVEAGFDAATALPEMAVISDRKMSIFD